MTPFDGGRDPRIDLLVDGELDPASRREFLLAMDASPSGWRACALAFLEAQEFRSAIGAAGRPAASQAPMIPRARPSRRPVAWAARAASVALAFGLGWVAHAPPGRVETIAPRMAEAPGRPAAPTIAPRPAVPPPATTQVASAPGPRVAAPVGYVQGKLEREGYRLEQRVLLLPAQTRDGRRVAVPVRQTAVRFVGNRAV